ncbi:electron transport complex subunit E [Pseudomonas cavernae]|uniref:Ion-translocating oxidoreductase complex subunit E n=1 Tax=Pseudomonas cavernae TaxID=2320867 RepID=A0A385Z5Q5_9PSED|nr:electron transport complex subunit E [Pseudomonas cavernae]AYC33850.1 electron transport complex subunit E [Pseudomonas cavernae]
MRTHPTYREITINGLWKNNPGLVQLLGLCPLLGTSNSMVNALGLGLATTLVLACSNAAVALIRNAVSDAVRLPIFVMIIAALTTCIELLMRAYTYELYQILGIFIPLITTNCIILGRAEAFAAKHNVLQAGFDGLMMGVGFGLVLLALGTLRELFGTGMLLGNMQLLFGSMAADWQISVFPHYQGFLLAILPPGAFLVLGLLIALKNRIDEMVAARAPVPQDDQTPAPSRRVRVTGVIE